MSETEQERDARRAVLAIVYETLGERRNHDARHQISLLAKAHGVAFVCAMAERAQEVQVQGGLKRKDGKRRTLGGVFFVLARESLGLEAYKAAALTGYQRRKLRQANNATYAERRQQEQAKPIEVMICRDAKVEALRAALDEGARSPIAEGYSLERVLARVART